MTTENISPRDIDFDEDDISYQIIARRRIERRNVLRRDSTLRLIKPEDARKLRNLDKKSSIQLRLGERRRQDRRISGPRILSSYEIKTLRKN